MERKERRFFAKPVELRAAAAEDGGQVFSGYVFEWNSLSEDMGGFVERVQRGATLAAVTNKKNIFATLDHQLHVEKVLGDRDTQTLRLFEDDRGFGFEILAGPTTAARDAAIVAGRNAIGVSLAFICGQDRWSVEGGQRVRDILAYEEIEEISLVVDAAYKSSDVTVARRSLQAIEAEEKAPTGPSIAYLRHRLELACLEAGIPLEPRANPQHNEDGRFHDEAITAAEAAIDAADSAHAAIVQDHRAATATSRARHQELVDAGKQPPIPAEPPAPVLPDNAAV